MQYAQILVKTKSDILDKKYSYLIPAKILAKISIGSLVSVPFGSKTKKGIVYNIIRTVPSGIKYKLKPILSLDYSFPVISRYQIALAKEISKKCLANLAQTIFFMVPEISKRLSKDKIFTFQEPKCTRQPEIVYSISDKKVNRIKHYVKLIEKAMKSNKSVLLLFADFAPNAFYIDVLRKKFANTIVFDPYDNLATKTNNFFRINENKSVLIIGTRNSILHHINNFGLIIIDEPTHFGYKEEQTIHHDSFTVAKSISGLIGTKVVIGDNIVDINITSQQIKKLYSNFNYFNNLPIKAINASASNDYLISFGLEQKITDSIKNKEKILIITNQNTVSSGLICAECKHLYYCPRCEHLLRLNSTSDDHLSCPICNYKMITPTKCANCGSLRLVNFGGTSHKVAQITSKLFPLEKIKILKTDKDYTNLPTNDVSIFISNKYIANWQQLSFAKTFVLSLEEMKINPNFDTDMSIIKTILKLSEITNNGLYLQTVNPEDELLKTFSLKRIDDCFKKELLMRNKFSYPPFVKFIKISYRHTIKNTAKTQIDTLNNNLEKFFKQKLTKQITFNGKTRDKYQYSILIKIKNSDFNLTLTTLYKKYQMLQLSKYLIDVEPIRLI